MWSIGSQIGSYRLVARLASDEVACSYLAERTGPLGFHRSVEISALHTQLSGSAPFARSFARTANLFARPPLVRLVPVEDIGIESGRLYRVGPANAGLRLPQWMQRLREQRIPLSVGARCLVALEVSSACLEARATTARGEPHTELRFAPGDVVVSRDGRVRLRCPMPSLPRASEPRVSPESPQAEVHRIATLLKALLVSDGSDGAASPIGARLTDLLSRALCNDPRQRFAHLGAFRTELVESMESAPSVAASELARAARRIHAVGSEALTECGESEDEPTIVEAESRRSSLPPPVLPRPGPPLDGLSGGARLRLLGASSQLELLPTSTRWVVGRDARADLVLADPDVSREHFEVVRVSGGGIALYDLGSKNGVRVNGQVVDERQLRNGDEILAGNTRLRVEC